MKILRAGAGRIPAGWAAGLALLLATAGLVYAQRALSGPLQFQVTGPARIVLRHPVVLEFGLLNTSKESLSVLRPKPFLSITGEVAGPDGIRFDFPGASPQWAHDPEPVVRLEPGGRLTQKIDIETLLALNMYRLTGNDARLKPGRYRVTLHYIGRKGAVRDADFWTGRVGPAVHTFELVPGPPPPPPPPVTFTPEQIRAREARKAEEARKRRQGDEAMLRLSRARNALMAERAARRKRLLEEADRLPPAPNERKSLLTEAQIDAQVRAAGEAGVYDQMRFGPDSPVETYESVRERFFVENLERLVAVRRRYLPTHRRLQKERSEWLTEAPEDRSLQVRQKMIDQAATLEPRTSEEQKRFEQMRASLLAAGELSAADYGRLERLLSWIGAARNKKR